MKCYLHVVIALYLRCSGSIVLCISLLTSIMMDQKAKFSPCDICTEFVGEVQDDNEAVTNILHRKAQLVFISPEGILLNHIFRGMFLDTTYKKHLVALVVEEAHCVN